MRSRFVSDPQDSSASLDSNFLPTVDLAVDSGGGAPLHRETAPDLALPDLPATGRTGTGQVKAAAGTGAEAGHG